MSQLEPQPAKKKSGCIGWLTTIIKWSLIIVGLLTTVFVLIGVFIINPSERAKKALTPTAIAMAAQPKKEIILVPTGTFVPVPTYTDTPVATTTPAPTNTPKPTATPTSAPTTTPLAGVTLDTANLRAGPGITYPVSGTVASGQTVRIVNKNEAGDWYELEGKLWIAAFLVNVGGQTASSPTASNINSAPPFSEIRAIMNAATDAQWNGYSASLKGKIVLDWTGWVDDVGEKIFVGGYEVQIDMDSPDELFSLYDVTFDIPNSMALKFSKNTPITFSGKIKSVGKVLGTLMIKLTDVGAIPSQ